MHLQMEDLRCFRLIVALGILAGFATFTFSGLHTLGRGRFFFSLTFALKVADSGNPFWSFISQEQTSRQSEAMKKAMSTFQP